MLRCAWQMTGWETKNDN